MGYCLKYAGISLQGRRRTNQDNFSINNVYLDRDHEDSCLLTGSLSLDHPYTFAVFDGLSGECDGESASWIGAKYLSENSSQIHEQDSSFLIKKSINQICLAMNQEICDYAAYKKYSNMGTAMAGLTFFPDSIYGYNLGDSGIYLFSQGKIKKCSRDHVCSNLFMKTGLTQYLGIPESEFVICPSLFVEKMKENDCYLICSDGFSNILSSEIMEEILCSYPSPEDSLRQMLAEAEEIGMTDNMTILLIRTESN